MNGPHFCCKVYGDGDFSNEISLTSEAVTNF